MRNSNQAFTNKPKRRRLGITALEELLGYSRQSFWRWYTKGDFPKPHYLGQKRCWFEDEVEAWAYKQMLANDSRVTSLRRCKMKAPNENPSWSIIPSLDNVPFQKIPGIWLNWRAIPSKHNSKPRKVPYQPDNPDLCAKTNDVSHCSDYDTARLNYDLEPGKIEGIGINLHALDPDKHPVTALDLDNCLDPNTRKLEPWAAEIVDACKTYAEVSPSGRGVRLFYDGMFEGGYFTKGSLECYISGTVRYVTLTGVPLPGRETGQVEPLSDAVAAILAGYQGDVKERDKGGDKPPVEEWDKDKVTDMLDRLYNEDTEWRESLPNYQPWLRLGWLRLGMALHHQFEGGDEGLEIWHHISEKLDNYEFDELDWRYGTFGGGTGQLTLLTYLQMARKKGLLPNAIGADEFPLLENADDLSTPVQSEETKDHVLDLGEDMFCAPDAANSPTPKEMIEDLLALKENSVFGGPPGSCKSLFALDAALSVASEKGNFYGQQMLHGPVMYLAYEGSGATKKRLRAYRAKRGTLPRDFILVEPTVSFSSPEFPAYLHERMERVRKKLGKYPRWIIIDTLMASWPGLKENDSESMGAVVSRSRGIVTQYPVHLTMIHHGTKSGSSSIRGHGSLEGDIDTSLEFTKGTNGVTVKVSKQRNLGSYGKEYPAGIEIVDTGQSTSFGKPEKAPILERRVETVMCMSTEEKELEDALIQTIEKSDKDSAPSEVWLTIRGDWLAKHYPEEEEGDQKKRVSHAINMLSHNGQVRFTRKKNNHIEEVILKQDRDAPALVVF
jgi:predicted DNA-binding transcriptional regulator AlpA